MLQVGDVLALAGTHEAVATARELLERTTVSEGGTPRIPQ
jgi:hypothetical protein